MQHPGDGKEHPAVTDDADIEQPPQSLQQVFPRNIIAAHVGTSGVLHCRSGASKQTQYPFQPQRQPHIRFRRLCGDGHAVSPQSPQVHQLPGAVVFVTAYDDLPHRKAHGLQAKPGKNGRKVPPHHGKIKGGFLLLGKELGKSHAKYGDPCRRLSPEAPGDSEATGQKIVQGVDSSLGRMPALAEFCLSLQATQTDPAAAYRKIQVPAGKLFLPKEVQQIRHGGILRLTAQGKNFLPAQPGQPLRQV